MTFTLDQAIAATETKINAGNNTDLRDSVQFADAFQNDDSAFMRITKIKPEYEGQNIPVQVCFDNGGLGWDVAEKPLSYEHNGTTIKTTHKALVRDDNGNQLGINSNKFRTTRMSTISNFLQNLCDDHGFQMSRVGYVDGGAKIFAFLKSNDHAWKIGNDTYLNHLMFATAFDGSLADTLQPFVENPYCFNQLAPMSRLVKPYRSKHSTDFKPLQAKINLGLLGEGFAETQARITALAKNRVTSNREAMAVIYSLLKSDDAKTIEDESTRKINQVADIFARFKGAGIGMNNESNKGTYAGLLNSITEYYDHEQGNNANNRFKSAMLGTGSEKKTEAFDLLDRIVNEETVVDLELIPATLV